MGTALLEFALAELPCPVRLKCALANTPAQVFYMARGTRALETITDGEDPCILYAFDAPPGAEPSQ